MGNTVLLHQLKATIYLGMFPIATCRQESAEGGCHSMTSTCSAYSSLYAVYQGYIDQGHPDHAHLEDELEELTALAECVNEAEPSPACSTNNKSC